MKFLRLKSVMALTGLARATIYQYIAAGTFPRAVPLGGRSVAWLESEILEWMSARVAERDVAG
ncbi:helix-turn-helix transcriptional regulator [Halopseudomonas maritima]|uniref:helix-turn-helix transcriptional regulator n=1 Tax=Halopseudomonas maritima TaxID=2918528 RepID=UPI001EEB264C|nr:AlpA family transcriptional regulator [Halopseudomonas maritima]UJJ31859.1 AlpA family transcriptional regulator [Halopseudomonas maritima]